MFSRPIQSVFSACFLPASFLMLTLAPSAQAAGGLFANMTPLTEPTPMVGDSFGAGYISGVAYSADGSTALVAAPSATVLSTSDAGKAYIYHYANGQWTLAKEIDDPDAAAGNSDFFGNALALNADGTVALIGSYAAVNGQTYAGKAYLYTLANGSWTQTKEFDDPAAAGTDYFGDYALGLSGNGQTAAIGASGASVGGAVGAGEIYIYAESNGVWSQSAAIPDPDGVQHDSFGSSIAVSGDGNSVLVGSEAAVSGQSNAGKAYLYTLANGSWGQAKEFDDPAAAIADYFGYSGVALSANGQSAVVGADQTTVNGVGYAGEAYIYSESNGVWSQSAAIPDPDATHDDYFGHSVTMSGNGESVLVGSGAAVNGQIDAGKAYLYTFANGSWVKTKEFDDPAATAYDRFGWSGVALSSGGESAFISASHTMVNGLTGAGEAYIYQSPDDLSLALSVMPSSVQTGYSVALNLTVSNTDPAVTAYNVKLTDTLPAGLTYAGNTAAGGTCNVSGQTVICTLASLAPNATWQPTITTTASVAGSLSDTANVVSNEPDPASGNNSATATVTATSQSTSSSGGGSGGGGASAPLGVALLAGLIALGGLRRRALRHDG